MDYEQYESSPTGLSYLLGNVMPWHDYVAFRSEEDVSVSVYGTKCKDMTWEDATVRTVRRSASFGSQYIVTESKYDSVTVDISNPYYAYGNVIGVNYDLPSSSNVMSCVVCGAIVFCALIFVFRCVWKLKKGIVG